MDAIADPFQDVDVRILALLPALVLGGHWRFLLIIRASESSPAAPLRCPSLGERNRRSRPSDRRISQTVKRSSNRRAPQKQAHRGNWGLDPDKIPHDRPLHA